MSALWGWISDFRARAMKAGDEARVRLSALHGPAFELRETDPDRALALYEEGEWLARVLGEPWWVLFYDHWRLTAMMHFQRDFRRAVELAVQCTLEIRKPQYDGLPLRQAFHIHLIAAYRCVDPHGYAAAAREALAYLEAQPPARIEDRYMLFGSQRELALALGNLDEAQERCRQSLVLAESDPTHSNKAHYGAFIHDALCEIAWRRQDWPALAQFGGVGEECARQVGHKMELADFLLWRALAAQRLGDADAARRLHRQSVAGVSRLRMPPEPVYFDALCSYLEGEGNIEGQWPVRERELASLRDKGRIDAESRCRLKRCRLLARLGRPMGEEMAAAREAAGRLRDPARQLAELDAVARGEAGPP